MKTLKQLSDRKLDVLIERLRLRLSRTVLPSDRERLTKLLWKASNEYLRRMGL